MGPYSFIYRTQSPRPSVRLEGLYLISYPLSRDFEYIKTNLVGRTRIELVTSCLQGKYSLKWVNSSYGARGETRTHTVSLPGDSKSPAAAITPLVHMVGMTGFEPATPWSQTRCTTKLCNIPMATDVGFEPTVPFKYDSFQNWCHKPDSANPSIGRNGR